MAKITRSIVDYIRENYVPFKTTQRMLADKFGLSEKHVRAILLGVAWPDGQKRSGWGKLTPAQEEAIIQLWNSSQHLRQRHPERWSRAKLAVAFHVSEGLITHVLSGRKRSVKEAIGFKS